jgi:hypothetical protein
MKYLRAVCPVSQYAPSAWKGWSITSTEIMTHTPGVEAGAYNSRGQRLASSGKPQAVHHLSRPAP